MTQKEVVNVPEYELPDEPFPFKVHYHTPAPDSVTRKVVSESGDVWFFERCVCGQDYPTMGFHAKVAKAWGLIDEKKEDHP